MLRAVCQEQYLIKLYHLSQKVFLYTVITGGAVAQPCVNRHWLSQWEALGTVIIDPPQN